MTLIPYPPVELVESANHIQLTHWFRYLPSPGSRAVGTPDFHDVSVFERTILDRIAARLQALGGTAPQVSKAADRSVYP